LQVTRPQENLRLDRAIERAAGGVIRVLQIVQDIARLLFDGRGVIGKSRIDARSRRNARLEVADELAGREDQITDVEGFRAIGERLWIVGRDRFFLPPLT